jgi:AcrR family transcriptional regulator
MPLNTFEKIPKEKQERVLNAAIKEFSRAPLNEASIANIIKDAKIPRGSFYQYFKDKEDIYYYILEEHSNDIRKNLLDNLIKTKGDIVISFIELYKYTINKINNPNYKVYFKNIFLNLNHQLERKFTLNLDDNLNDVINLTNINKLKIDSKLQLIYVIDILDAIFMHNLVQSYKRNISIEKNIEIFIKEIKLIVNGLAEVK